MGFSVVANTHFSSQVIFELVGLFQMREADLASRDFQGANWSVSPADLRRHQIFDDLTGADLVAVIFRREPLGFFHDPLFE